MSQLSNTLSEFLHDVKNQKLRTFLTLFGIIWGTVAIVILLAFGMGFQKQLTKSMHGIGQGIALLFPGTTTKAFQGFNSGRHIALHETDAELLTREVPGIAAISPEYNQWDIPIRRGENVLNPNITGVYPVFGEMRNLIAEPGGRFLNQIDENERRRVVFIGDKVKKYLFEEEEAVGQYILLGQMPFMVIGTLTPKTQNSSYNSRDEDRVFIPASTFSTVYGTTTIENMVYQVTDPRQSETVQEQIRAVLASRYIFDPSDEDAVGIWDTLEFDKFIFYFFLAFNLFMGMIGSFTLAVGGLGVANIMYIVVQERTREIGIKRSLGARKTTILGQFFLETLMIVGFGAFVGFAISFGLVELLQLIPDNEFVGKPVFTPSVAAAAGAILALIGLIAGLMPARRAAGLNIVECLRV